MLETNTINDIVRTHAHTHTHTQTHTGLQHWDMSCLFVAVCVMAERLKAHSVYTTHMGPS